MASSSNNMMNVEEAFQKWKAKPGNENKPEYLFAQDYMYNHEYGTAPDPAKMLENIRIVPFVTEPSETVDTGIILEVGKTYLNTLGEERTIVGTYDDFPYVFIDDQEFTYTRDGVYDIPDHWANADLFVLIEELK